MGQSERPYEESAIAETADRGVVSAERRKQIVQKSRSEFETVNK